MSNQQQPQSSYQALAGAFSSVMLREDMRAMQEEARARGISVLVIAQERREAAEARRTADAARVQSIIDGQSQARRMGATEAPTAAPAPTQPLNRAQRLAQWVAEHEAASERLSRWRAYQQSSECHPNNREKAEAPDWFV